jgi:hypothetical protein
MPTLLRKLRFEENQGTLSNVVSRIPPCGFCVVGLSPLRNIGHHCFVARNRAEMLQKMGNKNRR